MNKAELINSVAATAEVSKKEAEAVITATLDAITAALKEGDKVQLVGFGSFEVKKRAARIGRNPKTKESIEIPASVVPVFKAGKALKDAVAGDITAAMPYRAMINIINFIQAMDYVVPGFAAYETLLYSPELKFYSNRVKMDTDFNTSLQGLHCLGDSSGWTRGLMMASVMGTLMGRKIAEEG